MTSEARNEGSLRRLVRRCGCARFGAHDCAVHANQINGTPMAHVDPCLCPCHYDGCGDCDPCLGGRPDQCAIMGTPNAGIEFPERSGGKLQ